MWKRFREFLVQLTPQDELLEGSLNRNREALERQRRDAGLPECPKDLEKRPLRAA